MTKARDLANIVSGGFTAEDIPSLDTAKITTGTFVDARMPSTVLNSNVDLTNLSATNLTSGTVPIARLGSSGTKDSTTFLRGDNTFATAGGNMTPMFSATLSASQTISDATLSKINFDTEEYDTDNCYDNSTNYRFTPTTSGKYLVIIKLMVFDSGARLYNNILYLRKNGSNISQSTFDLRSSTGYGYLADLNIVKVISMNGSSDYLECFGYMDGAGTLQFDSGISFFSAYKIIE